MTPEEGLRKVANGERAPMPEAEPGSLMGARENLGGAGKTHLPDWFVAEVGDGIKATAESMLGDAAAGKVDLVPVEGYTDRNGKIHDRTKIRISSNPPWYRHLSEEYRLNGRRLDKQAVLAALQRIIDGKDKLRANDVVLRDMKNVIFELMSEGGRNPLLMLYDLPPISGLMGQMDEAARVYDAWINADYYGTHLTHDDLVRLAGSEENLTRVVEHYLGDTWREVVEPYEPGPIQQLPVPADDGAWARLDRALFSRPLLADPGGRAMSGGLLGWEKNYPEWYITQAHGELIGALEGMLSELPAVVDNLVQGDYPGWLLVLGTRISNQNNSATGAIDTVGGTIRNILDGRVGANWPDVQAEIMGIAVQRAGMEHPGGPLDLYTLGDLGALIEGEQFEDADMLVELLRDRFAVDDNQLRIFAGGDDNWQRLTNYIELRNMARKIVGDENTQGAITDVIDGDRAQRVAETAVANPEVTAEQIAATVLQALETDAAGPRLYDLRDRTERVLMLTEVFGIEPAFAELEAQILDSWAETQGERYGEPAASYWAGWTGQAARLEDVAQIEPGDQGLDLDALRVERRRRVEEFQATHGGVVRGAIDSGRKIIMGVLGDPGPAADTWVHESWHFFETSLRGADLVEVRRLFPDPEDAASAYVNWRATGDAPTPRLVAVFQQFRAFLRQVLQSVLGMPADWVPDNLTVDQRAFFRRMFALEPWEMTESQYAEARRTGQLDGGEPDKSKPMTPYRAEYEQMLRDAVRDGRPIPEHIIEMNLYLIERVRALMRPAADGPVVGTVEQMAVAGDVPPTEPTHKPAMPLVPADLLSPRRPPKQASMFASEDLPLFSGTAERGAEDVYRPEPADKQLTIPGMEAGPEMAGPVVDRGEAGGPLFEPPADDAAPVVVEPARPVGEPGDDVLDIGALTDQVIDQLQGWAKLEPARPVVTLLPGSQQTAGSSKNVVKLFEQMGIVNDVLKSEYYRKIENDPYIPLVIETFETPDGPAVYLTHWVEQNGDLMIDTEMVFIVEPDGTLDPFEFAYRDMFSQERRVPARDAKELFDRMSRNLLEQGFGKVGTETKKPAAQWPRERLMLDELVNRLRTGDLFSKSRSFEDYAEGLGFDMRKDDDLNTAYDVFEGALNVYAREVRAELETASLSDRIAAMVALENQLVKARRTLGKMALQQFSTPLPISEAADWAADVRRGDVVGDSTGGTGNLVDGITLMDGVAVKINELGAGRRQVLRAMGYDPSGLDLMKGEWLIGPDGKRLPAWANVQIVNPPWGAYSTGKYGKPINTPVKMNDWSQRFTFLMLQRLADGGRLVGIMPTNWLYTQSRTTRQITVHESEFLAWLRKNYQVKAIIESPDGAYDTRATGVGSLLVVIDKAPAPLFGETASLEAWGETRPLDWEQYAKLITDIPRRSEEDVKRSIEQLARQSEPEPQRPATGPDATGLVDPAARRGESRGDPADIGRMGVTREPTTDAVSGAPDGGRVDAGGDGSAAGPELLGDNAGLEQPGAAGEPVAGMVEREPRSVQKRDAGQPRKLSENFTQQLERSKLSVSESRSFTLYEGRCPLEPGDVANPHPTAVVETKGLSGVNYPPLEKAYRPSAGVMDALRRRVISVEGNLDPVWSAIQQNDREQSAMLVADDVGMGKSRTGAAYVLDRLEKGRKKILVITKGEQNVDNLMNREFPGVWGGDVDEYGAWVSVPENYPAERIAISGKNFPEAKKGADGLPVFDGPAVYFIADNNVAAFHEAILALGIDAVVVDEAHSFKNPDTQKGYAWNALHKDWIGRGADMLYLTATPGVDVADLQYLYGLRLWTMDGFGDWLKLITGEASPEEIKKRQATEDKIAAYAEDLQSARASIPQTPRTLTIDSWNKLDGLQVGDLFVCSTNGYDGTKYQIRDFPPGYQTSGRIVSATLRSETEAIIVADILNRNTNGRDITIDDLYQAMREYEAKYPSPSKSDLHTIGITDASDIQTRVDKKGGWGKDKKRSAFDMTLPPAHTEQIMRELKAGGYYMARDISRSGVEFEVKEYTPPAAAMRRFNDRVSLYQRIYKAFTKFGSMNEGPKKAAAMFGINGDIQGDAKRALFAMRLPGVIEETNAALARGEQVVISTVSVSEVTEGGRFLENAVSKINTQKVEKIGDGDPSEIPEALLEVLELREAMAELPDLASPIDMLNAVFMDRIGFVTGAQSPQERANVTRAFQSNQLDVVVISGAGKTGINLHDVTGKRRVHLIVADYEWSATTFKQELGRVDRTGQKTSPAVSVMHTGSAGERKFVATIANRMKGLGATSKGEAESTGTGALTEEFELGSKTDRVALAHTWETLTLEQRAQFLDRFFDDPQTPNVKKSTLPTDSKSIEKFLLALQTMSIKDGNDIYNAFEESKAYLADSDAAKEDAEQRASRSRGEIVRETQLTDGLRLVEVKSESGEKMGVVSGILTPEMNRLRNLIVPNSRDSYELLASPLSWMKWVQFYDPAKNQYASGLVVKPGRIKAVAEGFGKQAGGGWKPETALADMKAGDRIPVHGAEGHEWELYVGKAGFRAGLVIVDGAKMNQRDALMGNGARFDARGTFFFVPDENLQAFLKRFPIRNDTKPKPGEVLYQLTPVRPDMRGVDHKTLMKAYQDLITQFEELQATREMEQLDPKSGAMSYDAHRAEVDAAPAKLYLDLNGLKWVNETYAHLSGDIMLWAFGQVARGMGLNLYRSSTAGDEFIITANTIAEAEQMGADLLAAYQTKVVETAQPGMALTGLDFTYGVGVTKDEADAMATERKNAYYAQHGIARGSKPAGLQEVATGPDTMKATPAAAALTGKNAQGEWSYTSWGETRPLYLHPTAAAGRLARSQSPDGLSVVRMRAGVDVELGGSVVHVVGMVFEAGRMIAYVPDRFANMKEFQTADGPARVLGLDIDGSIVYLVGGEIKRQRQGGGATPAMGPYMLGTLDATGGAPVYHGQLQADAWSNWVMPAMDALQRRMINEGPAGGVRPAQGGQGGQGGGRPPLDQDTADMLRNWGKDLKRKLPAVKQTALRMGYAKRDAALLNYSDRTNADNLMGVVWPYQFWMTHSAANWAARMLDRPAWFSMLARMINFMDREDDDRPDRLRGKFKLPMAWLPDWAGDGVYIDPMSKLLPFMDFMRPLDRRMQDMDRQTRVANSLLQDWVKNGEITAEEAARAMKEKSGPLWERAAAMAMQDSGGDSWVDFASLFTSPALYLSLPYQLMTGQGNKISTTPLSQQLQGLAAATGMEGFANWDPEAAARQSAGLSQFGEFGYYYVERQLANMAIEGVISPQEAELGMIDHSGQAWEEATRRVQMELALKSPGMATLYNLRQAMAGKAGVADVVTSLLAGVFPATLFPAGELEYRGLKESFDQAYQAYQAGDQDILKQWFDDNPEYEARMALYRDPESRLKSFLISEIWDKYTALPALNKREVREQMPEFEQLFLNDELRSYESLTADQLAGWAEALGGVMPEAAGNVTVGNGLDLSNEMLANGYEAYLQEREAKFGTQLGDMLNQYYSLTAEQQDKFLQLNPALGDYFAWRDGYLAQHPEMIELLTSDESSLAGVPPDVAQWVYQYRADRAQMFGAGIFDVQNQYFELSGVARRAYLEQHQELKAYWDWQKTFMAQHPETIPYIKSTESMAKGVLGEDWQEKYSKVDFDRLPAEARAELGAYLMFGDDLSAGARLWVEYIWMQAGRPGGSLAEWLDALKSQ